MLRCRRCRKGVLDSTCLETVEETTESSTAVCNIWHVNVDMLPEWIMTSVHQAQWTVGKLKCQNCRARLGGFNFINRSECPCGQYATVHLSKSRVDQDQKPQVLIVQPRRMRSEKEASDPAQNIGERPAMNSLQLNCAAVMSHVFPAETSSTVADNENTFPFSPLYCISHQRRCSMEDDGAFRSSCFCTAGAMASFNLSKRVDEATPSAVSFPSRQQFDTGAEASFSAVADRPSVAAERQWDQELLQNVPGSVTEDISESDLTLRVDDPEQEEDVLLQAFPATNRLSKRERNRQKSVRRKQRRREQWLQSQLEQEQIVNRSLLDSEEEDREGLSCAVCLDIYFNPYSCRPCGHSFCEPCLRTLARNRPTSTPCPLCRTLISHTNFNKELNQSAKMVFPKVYTARKQNFQNAPCAKWPLPSFQRSFRAFWGYQRQTAMSRRRLHFTHAGFTLHTLNFTDMRGWLFDIGLVIIYIHSVNWILVLLLFCFLMYYFFF